MATHNVPRGRNQTKAPHILTGSDLSYVVCTLSERLRVFQRNTDVSYRLEMTVGAIISPARLITILLSVRHHPNPNSNPRLISCAAGLITELVSLIYQLLSLRLLRETTAPFL